MIGHRKVSDFCAFLVALVGVMTAPALLAQAPGHASETAQIMKADADFAQAVADKNRERFLSFLADVTTFNGGSQTELHGRDAVIKDWSDFFAPDGPTLSWTPTHGEVVGAGDLGYTTGRSLFRGKGPDGKMVERRGEYLTVWRKQRDGSWKVIFDTGSTLPPSR
jgi:ketosteroid isomerase-like protein